MPRDSIALSIDDVSAFARRLGGDLMRLGRLPGHAELLNALARAGGFRNHQHLRASAKAGARLAARAAQGAQVDEARIERALRSFGPEGRMVRWPSRTNLQELCLWIFWAELPAGRPMRETEVNEVLKAWHDFGDHALLRRSLIDHRLAQRSQDGREYRRIERKPPPEALAMIRALKARREA
jgi:hypothetical protein